jgi:hypothetical protein
VGGIVALAESGFLVVGVWVDVGLQCVENAYFYFGWRCWYVKCYIQRSVAEFVSSWSTTQTLSLPPPLEHQQLSRIRSAFTHHYPLRPLQLTPAHINKCHLPIVQTACLWFLAEIMGQVIHDTLFITSSNHKIVILERTVDCLAGRNIKIIW